MAWSQSEARAVRIRMFLALYALGCLSWLASGIRNLSQEDENTKTRGGTSIGVALALGLLGGITYYYPQKDWVFVIGCILSLVPCCFCHLSVMLATIKT